jgi:hypothetical protein
MKEKIIRFRPVTKGLIHFFCLLNLWQKLTNVSISKLIYNDHKYLSLTSFEMARDVSYTSVFKYETFVQKVAVFLSNVFHV